MRRLIVIVCGPPGAGKTTIAERVHRRLDERGEPFERLNSDQFSRRPYDRMFERVAEADAATDWILDGTFYERVWRERFRRFGDVRIVHLEATLEACLERNRTRERSIDERGVRAIHRRFERPRADLTIDTEEASVDQAVERVLSAVDRWRERP